MRKYAIGFVFIIAIVAYLFASNSGKSEPAESKSLQTIQNEKPIAKEDVSVRAPAGLKTPTQSVSKEKKSINAVSEELRQIIANNDYCGFQKYDFRKHSKDDREYMLDFVFGTKNEDSGDDDKGWDLECFHSKCRGQVGDFFGPDLSEATKFYNALYLGGLSMADDSDLSVEEFQRSYNMLLELTNKNPSNGAYPFFLAAIENKLKMPQEKIDEHIRMALLASEFELFYSKILRQMYIKYGLRNPLTNAVFFAAQDDYGPSLNLPTKLLNAFVKKHSEFQDSAMQLGEKLMASFQNQNYQDQWWETIPFSFGRSISKSAFEAKYPGRKLPPKYAKSFWDYNKEQQKRYLELVKNLKTGACNIEIMTSELNRIRANLLSK